MRLAAVVMTSRSPPPTTRTRFGDCARDPYPLPGSCETVVGLQLLKMYTVKPRLVVPYGLKTLLEGLTRAILKCNPSNIPEFAALYFRELIAFRGEHPNVDIIDLVREFHFAQDGLAERLSEKKTEARDKFTPEANVASPLFDEPKQKEKSTDTEEDQLLEGPVPDCSAKTTQYPSTHNELTENESSPTGPEPSSPKGPDLAYVPADPAQLAAQLLGNSDSLHSLKDVATSVQTLPEVSMSSEDTTAVPIEGAAEDATVVPAAEGSVRSESSAQSQSSMTRELGSSGSQVEQSASDTNHTPSIPLQEEPPPPPSPPPPPDDPLQAAPSPNEIEVTSTIQVLPMNNDEEEPVTEGEVPPYIEQFPQKIVIPFIDQVAGLLEIQPPLNAGQFICTKILDPSAVDAECDPEGMETTAQKASAEPGYVISAMATSEAGQPPPYSNVWTLYCLTDLSQQGRKSPPPLPPVGTGAPYPQATLYISSGKEQQQVLQQQMTQGQQVSSPTYVMTEESKQGNAPPFILVGSTVQNAQDWKSIPGHAVLAQQDASVVRRFTTVPIPVARAADLKTVTPNPNPNSAQQPARPPTPVFLSVAIPLDDVMSAKRGSGDKQANPFAGSYGIAGEITFTSASVRRADS
ncbi:calcium-binding tyrosine phosphorylation-regulated protein isoform X2 [Alligator mississippiensis]|uniref:calcium-binding tyrosine phosphorylation-regulated protein isoform X2 n=1 Tax=Alligator mississippiensis TaxID=8496 RepID=UPI002877AE30|nr:calcium-binding tyrosine phosphorylation-regulated protein isoform X2 [Alligator mississippiensis]